MVDIVVKYKGLTGVQNELTIDNGQTVNQLLAAIAADEGITASHYNIALGRDYSINETASGGSTLTSLDIVTGDEFLCTPDQSGNKEEKQKQKLDIAAAKRSDTYDITQLPTQYSGNDITDNPNTGGLVNTRPWASTSSFVNPTLTIGSAVTTEAASPFAGGGNSYVFSSSVNSYITTPGSADFSMGTGDFTVEWFSRQSSLTSPQYQRIFTVGDFPSIEFGVSIESGTFYYWADDSFRYSSSSASTINTWIHWAVVRQSNVTKVYRNGTQLGSQITDNNDIDDSATTFVVGNTNTFATNAALAGNLTNFRLIKGLAVYTGNFTVPTSALTATADANPYGGSNTAAIPSGVTKLLLVP